MRLLRFIYPLFLALSLAVFLLPTINQYLKPATCAIQFIYILIFLNKYRKSELSYLRWEIAFCVFCCLSCVWAIDTKTALWVILKPMLPIFITCTAVFLYIDGERSTRNVLLCYFAASIALLLYVVLYIDFTDLAGNRLSTEAYDELEGWNSNCIGMYLAFGCYSGYLAMFKSETMKLLRGAYLLIAASMIAIVLLSGSRGALVILMIPVLFVAMKNSRNVVASVFVVGILLFSSYFLVMKVPVLYSNIGIRIEEMFNILSASGDGSGDDSRLLLITNGLMWYKEAPILGVGINNFRILSSTRLFVNKFFYAHNNYVELLVDIGFVGFMFYYSAYYFLFKNRRLLSRAKRIWFIAFICVLLFADMTNVSYYDPALQFVICILFSQVKIAKSSKNSRMTSNYLVSVN